jgi:hypothetical protein
VTEANSEHFLVQSSRFIPLHGHQPVHHTISTAHLLQQVRPAQFLRSVSVPWVFRVTPHCLEAGSVPRGGLW